MRALALALVALVMLPLTTATMTDPLQSDAGRPGDAPNDPGDVRVLSDPGPQPATYDGTLILVDDPADWYVFHVNETGGFGLRVSMDATPCVSAGDVVAATTTFSARVIDAQGATLQSFATTACTASNVELSAPNAPPGDYRIGFTYDQTTLLAAKTTTSSRTAASADAGTPTSPNAVVDYVFRLCHPYC